MARRSIIALTEGNSAARFETRPYRRINRPMYPLDDDVEFSGGLELVLWHMIPFRHFTIRDIRQYFIYVLEQRLLVDAFREISESV